MYSCTDVAQSKLKWKPQTCPYDNLCKINKTYVSVISISLKQCTAVHGFSKYFQEADVRLVLRCYLSLTQLTSVNSPRFPV